MHAELETEDDLVPRLRSDLVITPSPQSRGTRDVSDPVANKTFALYDFEVTIARMLDGTRTAGEVIGAANRLGIPVTLPTLRTFLGQLRAYQFIDTAAATGEPTTWAPRRKWTAEARELYQSALRLLRAGKFDDARGYVDALLATDPDNEEIAPLRARIDAAAAGNPDPGQPFDEMLTPASPVPFALETEPKPEAPPPTLPVPSLGGVDLTEPMVAATAPPRTTSLQGLAIDAIAPLMPAPSPARRTVELSTPEADAPPPMSSSLSSVPVEVDAPPMSSSLSSVPVDVDAPPMSSSLSSVPVEVTAPDAAPLPEVTAPDAAPLPEVTAPDAAPLAPAKKTSKAPLLIAAVVVLALAGVLLRPVDARVTLPCELKAVPLGSATAPRAGTVKQAEVQRGEFVVKGAVIARLEVSLDDTPAAFSSRQEALENELASLRAAPPAKVKKAKAAVKKAERALKTASKAAAKAKGKKVAAAQKTVALKTAALEKAQAALETLTHEQQRTELKARLQQLDDEQAAAAQRLARSTIEAPADGVVLLPELPVTLEENAAFAQLVAPKLAIETAGALPEGATKATLKLATSERPVTIQNGKATVTLDPALVNVKGELIFPGKRQPWVLTLLGP